MWKKMKFDKSHTNALNHVDYEINVSDMNHNLKHVKGSSFFLQLRFVVGPSTTNHTFGSMICTINNHQAVALNVEQSLPLQDQKFFFWQHIFELQTFGVSNTKSSHHTIISTNPFSLRRAKPPVEFLWQYMIFDSTITTYNSGV